jgi:HK97 family phage portal protein
MAYLQQLVQEQNRQVQQQQINATNFFGLERGEAYAQYFPTWEVTAPQYPQPNAYTLAQLGYRTNEVAYACINLWMKTISEPQIKIYDKETQEEVVIDEFLRFMEEPCPGITENDFWNATEMYLKIAGTMAWEKDLTNSGKLKSIWPMMPQYCSYLRGEGKLLRAIRYQPYTGLPFLDVDRERVVMFMYIDPLFYGLKPLSPTAVLADIIGVDNNMTKMVQQFLRNGAFVSGLLSTDQVLNEADAKFAKERFRESHGGPENAGDVMVQGKGIKFERVSNTFREMVFPEVDARSETRICQGYSVKPILVSAKVGMDRSTFNNYEQARQAWYDEEVTSEWAFLEKRITLDILPHFSDNPNHYCKFDIRNVKALQEDRNKQWERAREAYKARIIKRNMTLIEMGLDPLGDSDPAGEEYYQTSMVQTSTSIQDSLDVPNITDAKREKEEPDKDEEKLELEEEEEKHFRTFAKRRMKENKPHDIGEYEFKYTDVKRQRQLLSEFGVPDPDAEMVLRGLTQLVEAMSSPKKSKEEEMIININNPQNVEMTGKDAIGAINSLVENIDKLGRSIKATPALPAPVVNVNVEPTPVTNKISVSPTPVNNNVTVNTPKAKREYQKIKRDGGNNIEGTVTEIEYEDDVK